MLVLALVLDQTQILQQPQSLAFRRLIHPRWLVLVVLSHFLVLKLFRLVLVRLRSHQ